VSYTLPTFNLVCNIWRFANYPANPPDLGAICNLALGRRVGTLLSNTATGGEVIGGMWLLLPPTTDIQDSKNGGDGDIVEVPAGSGRIYKAIWVDDIGGGFPNEHRFAELVGFAPWPTPFPGCGAIVPPALPAVLMESSGWIHLEDFSYLLLE